VVLLPKKHTCTFAQTTSYERGSRRMPNVNLLTVSAKYQATHESVCVYTCQPLCRLPLVCRSINTFLSRLTARKQTGNLTKGTRGKIGKPTFGHKSHPNPGECATSSACASVPPGICQRFVRMIANDRQALLCRVGEKFAGGHAQLMGKAEASESR